MGNIKGIILAVLSFGFYIGLIVLYIGGIIHGFKKHGETEGVIAIFAPPYTLYLAVEKFFHTDDADWEVKLNQSTRIFVMLCNRIYDNKGENVESIEATSHFKDALSDLTPEKKEQIIFRAKRYIRFENGLRADLIAYVKKRALNRSLKVDFFFSKATNELSQELKGYGLAQEIDKMLIQEKEVINQLNKAFEQDNPPIETEVELDKRIAKIKDEYFKPSQMAVNSLYKDLFGEEYAE